MMSHKEVRRVICPHCNGHKTTMTLTEVIGPEKYERADITCPFCDGEGIMEKVTTYSKIK